MMERYDIVRDMLPPVRKYKILKLDISEESEYSLSFILKARSDIFTVDDIKGFLSQLNTISGCEFAYFNILYFLAGGSMSLTISSLSII